jgi:hypothetical protein
MAKEEAKNQYVLVTFGNIHTQIAKTTDIEGYTVGIISAYLPEDHEIEQLGEKGTKEWVAANNKRMEAICKFLNDNNL